MSVLVNTSTRLVCQGFIRNSGLNVIAVDSLSDAAQKIVKAVRCLIFFTAFFATPAMAQLDVDLVALLSDPDSVPEAAIAACALGVADPSAADAALTGAKWKKSAGESDGTSEYTAGQTYVMMWNTPGFCMVEDTSLRTVEMWDALEALGAQSIPSATGADGCEVFTLTGGVKATLSGPGQDPVCTSEMGAALRFERSQ
jgi:hypothetical protein